MLSDSPASSDQLACLPSHPLAFDSEMTFGGIFNVCSCFPLMAVCCTHSFHTEHSFQMLLCPLQVHSAQESVAFLLSFLLSLQKVNERV